MHSDLLMSYGKHYEELAGVFKDLAALPSITDDQEVTNKYVQPTFAI